MFLKLTTGGNVKKTYSSLSLDCKSKPAGVLVTGVIFQASLVDQSFMDHGNPKSSLPAFFFVNVRLNSKDTRDKQINI